MPAWFVDETGHAGSEHLDSAYVAGYDAKAGADPDVYSVEPHEADERLEALFAAAAPAPDCGWTRAELERHVRDEHSTFSWLLEPLLEHAGFEIRAAEHRQHVYSTYVCVKPP
jgi:hypothetical protein